MHDRRGRHGIAVTGVGTVSAVPDVMRLLLGISVRRDSVAAARTDAAELAQAMGETLRSAGIADGDIQTAHFGVHPEYRHTDRRRILEGYRVTSALAVAIRDIGRAGDVIDAAVAVGGNDVVVDRVWFTLEDDRAARNEARAAAWADAHTKAQHLASLAGVDLGPARWIGEPQPSPGGPPVPMARMAAAAEAATPIESGSTDITVTLDVRFEIVE